MTNVAVSFRRRSEKFVDGTKGRFGVPDSIPSRYVAYHVERRRTMCTHAIKRSFWDNFRSEFSYAIFDICFIRSEVRGQR